MRLIYGLVTVICFLIGWSIASPAVVLGAFWAIWIHAFRFGQLKMNHTLMQLNRAENRSRPYGHTSCR